MINHQVKSQKPACRSVSRGKEKSEKSLGYENDSHVFCVHAFCVLC